MSSLSISASQIVARLSSGDLKGASVAEIQTLLGVGESEFTVLDRDSTTVSVNTTTTETTVYSFSIPADTMGTNKLIQLKMGGTFKNNSGGTRNVTARFKYGSTTFASPVRGVGGPNTAVGFVGNFFMVADGSTSSQRAWFDLKWEGGSSGHLGLIGGGTSSEDSTGALTLSVTIEHGYSHSGLDFTHEYSQLTLEG